MPEPRPPASPGPAGVGVVITCEHGGNLIPPACRDLFVDHQALLATHRGHDPGALVMAQQLATGFAAPLVFSTVSRLVVDLNRSIGHPRLHFETIRAAPPALRQRIVADHYLPFRAQAEALVRQAIADHGRVIHLSSHSFTPVLDGQVRHADIGLLYDPARPWEVALCQRWKAALQARAPEFRVRRNYPYRGRGDGLTAWFRKRLAPEAYAGIELEVNQQIVMNGGHPWAVLRQAVQDSLGVILAVPCP